MAEKKLLLFTGPYGSYSSGDVAGFDPDQAERILKITQNAKPYKVGDPIVIEEEDEPEPEVVAEPPKARRGRQTAPPTGKRGKRGSRSTEKADPTAM